MGWAGVLVKDGLSSLGISFPQLLGRGMVRNPGRSKLKTTRRLRDPDLHEKNTEKKEEEEKKHWQLVNGG